MGTGERDDGVAGPSLFLASTEKAHREHLHQHNFLHKNRRQAETEIDVQQVVTEVVQTVSYVQQIDVDSNGSTFSILTLLADATGGVATTDPSSAATTTDPASPGVTNTASSASSTTAAVIQPDSSTSQSLPFNLSTTSSSPSASSIPTSSFALLIVSSNSTTLISSSSSQIRTFSNSTINSSSSLTYLTSSSLTSSETSSSYFPSSSSYTSYLSSDSNATPTAGSVNGGTAGGTGAATGSSSTSTAAAGNGTSSDSTTTTSTSTVVGGVVGGVAGAAVLIFLLMMLLRWKKRHQSMLLLGSGDRGSGGTTSRGIEAPPPIQPSGGMSGPRSSLFAVPAALASLTGFKRQSDQNTSTDAGGERGFYRVSGRKLPSVLQSGGDGYGDGVVDNTLSGSSFYRDSQGYYGGLGSPTSAAPVSTQRPESGIPVMRPSPARTPVTEHGPFAFGPAPLTPPNRPDMLGRSHPSQDGSHASRFTEEV